MLRTPRDVLKNMQIERCQSNKQPLMRNTVKKHSYLAVSLSAKFIQNANQRLFDDPFAFRLWWMLLSCC